MRKSPMMTCSSPNLSNDVSVVGPLLIADNGAHPVWHLTSEEYCDIVNELVG
jgi:hypothetical protein